MTLRFSLFGIPIAIDPTFWLSAILLASPTHADAATFARVLIWAAVLFVSILVHELGHALTMRRFGRASSIRMHALGGDASYGDGAAVSGSQRILVSLAGPFAGFALALPIVTVHRAGWLPDTPWFALAYQDIIWVNVWWGVINLAPMLPLDGGRAMQTGLVQVLGVRGGRIAKYFSMGLGLALLAWGLRERATWWLWLALVGVWQTLRESPMERADIPATAPAEPLTTASETTPNPLKEAWEKLVSGDPELAEELAERALATLPDEPYAASYRRHLLELAAWASLESGHIEQAIAHTARIPTSETLSPVLAARLAYAQTPTDPALDALISTFEAAPGQLELMVVSAVLLERGSISRIVDLLRSHGEALGAAAHQRTAAQLFYARHFEEALAIEELSWSRFRDDTAAFNAACCTAQLGRLNEGMDWLQRAIEAGYRDREQAESDTDLAPLRAAPHFDELLARMRPKRDRPRVSWGRIPWLLALTLVVLVGRSLWVSRHADDRSERPTPKTIERQLAQLNELCADVWCEGEFNLDFHRLDVDARGATLRISFLGDTRSDAVPTETNGPHFQSKVLSESASDRCDEGLRSPCRVVETECHLPRVSNADELLEESGYQDLCDCISSLEDSLSTARLRAADAGAQQGRAAPSASTH